MVIWAIGFAFRGASEEDEKVVPAALIAGSGEAEDAIRNAVGVPPKVRDCASGQSSMIGGGGWMDG